MYKNKHKTEK